VSEKRKLRSTTADRISALEATEQGGEGLKNQTAKPATAEAIGVGDSPDERIANTARIVAALRKKFEIASRAGNTKSANDFRDRIKAVIAAGQ